MSDENDRASNEVGIGYANYGLSVPASIATNTIITVQYTIVEGFGFSAFGRAGGALTTVVVGSVDVVDAYYHGSPEDVIVQSAGVGGGLLGGFLGGAAIGGTAGALGFNPVTVGIGTVVGGVAGAYLGEEWVQSSVDSWLNSDTAPPEAHDFLPGILSTEPVAPSYNPYTGSISFGYNFGFSGGNEDSEGGTFRVRTAVSVDSDNGGRVPVTTVVLNSNPVSGSNLDLLYGNVYDPSNIGVGHELNGLDRLAHEAWLALGESEPTNSTSPASSGWSVGYGYDPRGPHKNPEYGWEREEKDPAQSVNNPIDPKEFPAPNSPGLPMNAAAQAGVSPILLDLDGLGLSVTELSQSTTFVDGGDGLGHRTAWAGAGDGVLFFDADGSGDISEQRECVFTDWDPTATSDLEALRSVFDTNGDGKLTSAGTTWSQFKVAVTEPDGTLSSHTLAALGITEIDLMGDATQIELPDGSVITGRTTFTMNGQTRTVGEMALATDGAGIG